MLTDQAAHLYQHYLSLREERLPEHPVFVLEHGLEQEALADLRSALCESCLRQGYQERYWLPWVVHAAEIGYKFSGLEYWTVFDEETPGWSRWESHQIRRRWLVRQFQKFARMCGGHKPEGDWAQRYCNISWPVSHAILPRDLQQQLAEALYRLRDHDLEAALRDPLRLASLLEKVSRYSSRRFGQFLEQRRLVSIIGRALLDPEAGTGHLGILPSTLDRIVADLETERQGRDWLAHARTRTREIRRRGIRPLFEVPIGVGGEGPQPDEVPTPVRSLALGIEPMLSLRPGSTEGSGWVAEITIPPLEYLERYAEDLPDLLRRNYATVAGAKERRFPARALLRAGRTVQLERWPDPREDLLLFTRAIGAQLERLLFEECRLRPGPWLFRVQTDGRGYEQKGHHVRPGERYLLLHAEGDVPGGSLPEGMRRVDIACTGIICWELPVPDVLDESYRAALDGLGLREALSVSVAPVGMPAAIWDGDGHLEMLADQPFFLSVIADHQVSDFELRLRKRVAEEEAAVEAGNPLRLTTDEPGQPSYVAVPPLRPGRYTLTVEAKHVKGELDIVVREAQPWDVLLEQRQPFALRLLPENATLEDLEEALVDVQINGPAGRTASVRMTLKGLTEAREHVQAWETRETWEGTFSAHPSSEMELALSLPAIPLPCARHDWYNYVENEVFPAVPAHRWEQASEVEFLLDASELGALRFVLPRSDFRWVLEQGMDGSLMRLVNLAETEAVKVKLLSPLNLLSSEDLAYDRCVDPGIEPACEGSLFVAYYEGRATSAFAANPSADFQLGSIDQQPMLEVVPTGLLLSFHEVWAKAATFGYERAKKTVHAVRRELVRGMLAPILGAHWKPCEEALAEPETAASALFQLTSKVWPGGNTHRLSQHLARLRSRIGSMALDMRVVALESVARDYLDDASGGAARWEAEAALRFASGDPSFLEWVGERQEATLSFFCEYAPLVEVARFMVWAAHHASRSDTDNTRGPQPLYHSWDWN